jgi:hypothetical protein
MQVCSPRMSFFFGVVAPWILTAFLYNTDILSIFCNWVAIVIQGYINFVVPVVLYRAALLRYPDHMAEQHMTRDKNGLVVFEVPSMDSLLPPSIRVSDPLNEAIR